MKRIAVAMCVVMILATLPRSSWASGEKATAAEDAKYAALEATSPQAAAFKGGDAGSVWLIIFLILVLSGWLFSASDRIHPLSESDGGLAQLPPQFR